MTGTFTSVPCVRLPGYILLACLALLLSACGPSEPVKIGFVGGMSGRVADLGIAGRNAVQLAVDLRNQAGGIGGREIRLLVKNDEHDPEVAVRVTQELIDQGVTAIVGPMTSDMAMVAAPLVTRARVLMMSPTATTEYLSGRDDYFFRVTSTTRQYASANAAYQIKSGRMRRVSAIYDVGNRSFTEMWLKHFSEVFEQGGGKILARIEFTSGSQAGHYQAAQELLSSDPDGVLIVANAMDSASLCQQIRKLDKDLPITLADWGATEVLLELGGRAVEGVVVVQTFDRRKTTPRYQEFRAKYQRRFGREPGFPGVNAFEAAGVVLDTLAAQGQGEDLKQTVLRIRRYQGLQAEFSFDDFGDVVRPHTSLSVVRDSQFVAVE